MTERVAERARLHPCVAHRGWSGGAPENTIAAFRLALSEPEVRWLELDVHLSKDEVPVVIHDGKLNRTTSGKGRVAERTAAELARTDAGSWFHPVYGEETIPTLEEVLRLACGRSHLNIELKEGPNGKLLARRTVEMIRSHRMDADVVITSFDRRLIQEVKRVAPEIATGLILDRRPRGLVPLLQSLQASMLSLQYDMLSESLLRETADAGIRVMVWTVNDPGALLRLTAMPQPFLICTNYPDRWLAAVKEGS
ncbi:glycerophosphodiester phosphodiesterase [Cohnella zeiphila]|uniref:Glycerophosphodiester phosphodiesterase n=1 Tax=Cohnella zeiphila TaxID=2761120 RepID=A0A7X0SS20_9BACL|nr:glycerophosphodiester phosphodiesterase family protein [Cohnella zeiphila]MBB6735061.1 glycerophosphodiester phosphodiesterase [Cohnella zeiphila]